MVLDEVKKLKFALLLLFGVNFTGRFQMAVNCRVPCNAMDGEKIGCFGYGHAAGFRLTCEEMVHVSHLFVPFLRRDLLREAYTFKFFSRSDSSMLAE